MAKNELLLPSLRLGVKNQEVHDTIKGILDSGMYASVIYTLLHKLTKDPDILLLKQSSTDAKLSKTISGMESIAKVLNNMNDDNGQLKYQLTESAKIMEKLTTEIISVRDQNKVQQETLSETLEVLSASNEGLAILKELNDKSKISLSDIVRNTKVDDSIVEEINEKVVELRDERLSFGYAEVSATESYSDFGGFDGDGDDLLGGSDLTDEESAEIMRRFRPVE